MSEENHQKPKHRLFKPNECPQVPKSNVIKKRLKCLFYNTFRIRPKSSTFLDETEAHLHGLPRRDSMPEFPTRPTIRLKILDQKCALADLKNELAAEGAKLEALKKEVQVLEDYNSQERGDLELEAQFRREIRHLRCQCERLANELDLMENRKAAGSFYENIYTGPVGRFHYR